MSLKSAFKRHCLEKKLHINESQIHTIDLLDNFFNQNKSNLLNLFGLLKSNLMKTAFYLRGDVGVGKTMILDFFLNTRTY